MSSHGSQPAPIVCHATTAPTKHTVRMPIEIPYRSSREPMSSLWPDLADVIEYTGSSLGSLRASRSMPPAYACRPWRHDGRMSNRTYRITEVVGTSPDGITEAVQNGIARAGSTLRHLDWFEVTEIRGQIVDTDVSHFQVTMKLGFRLEDDE